MTDLDVLFVQPRLCSRAWKEAKALTDSGATVSLVEFAEPAPIMDYSHFARHVNLPFRSNLVDMVRDRRPILRAVNDVIREVRPDIVHTHNGPDCLGAWLPGVTPTPVVHDIHDIETAEPTRWPETARFHRLKSRVIDRMKMRWERRSSTRTSAVLTTSPMMAQLIRERHGAERVFALENKPFRTDFTPLPKRSAQDGGTHIVYAGSVTFGTGTSRDLLSVFQAMAAQGLHVHIYHVAYNAEVRGAVRAAVADEPNIHLHDPIAQDHFIAEMSQYDHGIIWFTTVNDNIRVTTQNKLYEFQVAGLPIITNLREGYTARYIQAKGCGIVVDDASEVASALARAGPFDLDTSDCYMDGKDILRVYDIVLSGR